MVRKAARNMCSSNTNKIGIQCICWFYSQGICYDARSYDRKIHWSGSCERRNEFRGSTKFGEILGYLRFYSIFKKDSIPWNLLRTNLDKYLLVCVCVCVCVWCGVCVCVCVCNCDLRAFVCVCVCLRVRVRDLVVRDALSHLIICKAMATVFIKLCTKIIPGFPPLKFITACQNINMLTTRTF